MQENNISIVKHRGDGASLKAIRESEVIKCTDYDYDEPDLNKRCAKCYKFGCPARLS